MWSKLSGYVDADDDGMLGTVPTEFKAESCTPRTSNHPTSVLDSAHTSAP